MNLRYKILEAVSKSPGAPASEICEVIEHDKQKTTWSVRDCAKAGLLSVRRDDVTGLPGYTLTDAGKARLAEGPASKQGSNMQQEAARKDDAPPEPASKPEDDGAGPAEQLQAVIGVPGERGEELAQIRTLLAGRVGYNIDPGYLSEVELADRAATMIDELQQRTQAQDQALQQQTALVAELRRALQTSTELLTEQQDAAERAVADLTARLADKDAGFSLLEVELRAEIARLQSENIALKTLNDAMPGFGAAFEGRNQHVGYLLRAAKRKPITIKSEEKARAAALSAIKAGAQRAEVFALVPVGCARKAATWEPA